MTYTQSFIMLGVWVLFLLSPEIGYTTEKTVLMFGQFSPQFDHQQKQQVLGPGFSAQEALILPIDKKTFILYQNKAIEATFSFFEQGNEYVLRNLEMGTMSSVLVPAPVLATGNLNANIIPDVFLSYSNDQGTSNSSEIYKQSLLLFVDGQHEATPSIPLSAADWYLRDEEPRYRLTSDGKHPGWGRESLVMLAPATPNTVCTMYIWSRMRVFEHPPTKTRASESFQLTTYQLRNTQVVKTEEISGTHRHTINLLCAMIKTKRAQDEEPIFLNMTDWISPLKTEEEWFSWWGTPE